MGATLKRDELDRLAQFYALPAPAVGTLLDVANARPSAAGILVLDVARSIFSGWQPHGGLLWSVFGGRGISQGHELLASAALNLALWFAAEQFPWSGAPGWVRRVVITCGVAFVTWAG